MESQAIIDAIKANPALFSEVYTAVSDLAPVKSLFDAKVKAGVDAQIGEKIKGAYDVIDGHALTIIGEKPKELQGGQKEKTSEMVARIMTEYKRLRDMESQLTEAEAVKALQTQIDKLKTEGGGKWIQEQFDAAKTAWEKEKAELIKRAEKAEGDVTGALKGNQIEAAKAGLKYNPDVKDSIKNSILATATAHLLQNSKIEGDKVIFLDAEGKPLLNPSTYQPMTAAEALMTLDAVKDITLVQNSNPGGGADVTVKGSIETKKVEGKDQKRLVLQGGFKSKVEFDEAADKALLESGFARNDPQFTQLKDAAYAEHNVKDLPRTV